MITVRVVVSTASIMTITVIIGITSIIIKRLRSESIH